jgi:hypothetical protein
MERRFQPRCWIQSTVTASHLASARQATRHSANGISPTAGGAYVAEQLYL